MKPSEAWLQYVWQNQILKPGLRSVDGNDIMVIERGSLNRDAGPDFLNAMVRIGGTDWVGNVEIHLRSSEWIRHGHHLDPAYDNVILHVVLEDDEPVPTSQGELIPTLELGKYLYNNSWNRYLALLGRRKSIPCQPYLRSVSSILFLKTLERMAAERLDQRVARIENDYSLSGLEPDQLAYQQLARTFGFQVNSDAFSILSKVLPYRILRSHLTDLKTCESLLFGAAGLLQNRQTSYASQLYSEWRHYQSKYDLYPMKAKAWRYARTRQSNNPELRIAQLAALLVKLNPIFDSLAVQPISDLVHLLQPKLSEYWHMHSRLNGKPGNFHKLSQATIDSFIINAVVPLRSFSSRYLGQNDDADPGLDILSDLSAEQNRITRMWESNGFLIRTAIESQGELQLHKYYCKRKRCLECPISVAILKDRAAIQQVP